MSNTFSSMKKYLYQIDKKETTEYNEKKDNGVNTT